MLDPKLPVTTDPASFPPFIRITVHTYEAGHRYRTDTVAVPVIEWRSGREHVLLNLAKTLDAAADAADAAYDASRLAGPKGKLP